MTPPKPMLSAARGLTIWLPTSPAAQTWFNLGDRDLATHLVRTQMLNAGYPLSQDEIAALLVRKQQVERSSNCPHGRPTTLRLTIGDLERQFKRK